MGIVMIEEDYEEEERRLVDEGLRLAKAFECAGVRLVTHRGMLRGAVVNISNKESIFIRASDYPATKFHYSFGNGRFGSHYEVDDPSDLFRLRINEIDREIRAASRQMKLARSMQNALRKMQGALRRKKK